ATIDAGLIVGTTTTIAAATVAVNQFLGIPYASVPTESARFSPPSLPATWNGTLNTTSSRSSCIQVFHTTLQGEYLEDIFGGPKESESEDCLYLNVFAPRKSVNILKPAFPVLYWLHPGGSTFGNIAQPLYDGSHFAAFEDVIVVTVQYRLDVFGFPQTSEISNLTERNLGLLDQRAGLDWIHRNIKSFGGDTSKITIFGASFGSMATDALITSYSPDVKPPFQAAIMMSGTYAWASHQQCNNSDFTSWDTFTNSLNCDSLECVKSKSADEIRAIRSKQSFFFGQACDNVTFVSDPRLRKSAGNFAQVPIMLGSSTGDANYQLAAIGITDVDAYFATFFPGQSELKTKVLAAYPVGSGDGADNITQLAGIHTEWNFRCPTLFNSMDSAKSVPTFRYIYNATFPNTRQTSPNITAIWPLKDQGAWHTSELADVFSTYDDAYPSVRAPPEEEALSAVVRGAWAAFARNPANAPVNGWKRVES
ncbi:alpha/beta-hydrolase, partial [Pleomassaria siparia CBS 279.74]